MADDSLMFITCPDCIHDPERGILRQSPREYGRLQVGVTRDGDLLVWCVRHDKEVSRLKNERVAHDLLYLAGRPCSLKHHHGSTH